MQETVGVHVLKIGSIVEFNSSVTLVSDIVPIEENLDTH